MTEKTKSKKASATKGNPFRSNLSNTTKAIFDLLSDEQQHSKEEVIEFAMAAVLSENYLKCIEEGKRARRNRPATTQEYAHSGARHFARNNLMIAERNKRVFVLGKNENTRYKMPVDIARAWKASREIEKAHQQREAVTTQPFGDVTFYADLSEWEGWAYAPLIARDIAHVRPSKTIPLSTLKKAFPGWGITEGPDGLISISAHPGAPVKEVVTEWFSANEIHHDGVRDAHNVKRRDLKQLYPPFFEDVMKKSVAFAKGLAAARYNASLQKLIGDTQDIEGYIILWVLELATSFDATLGRPFGTWVTNQLPRKIQDLNRAINGRTASDAEMRHARARIDFETEHGKSPSNEELREILGLTAEEMKNKQRHISNLTGMRMATTFDTGPDEADIHIVDESANPERDALAREKSEQITLALISVCTKFDSTTGRLTITRPLGLLMTYLMHWDDWVKGDLVALAGCADRKATDEIDAVQTDLGKRLRDHRHTTSHK